MRSVLKKTHLVISYSNQSLCIICTTAVYVLEVNNQNQRLRKLLQSALEEEKYGEDKSGRDDSEYSDEDESARDEPEEESSGNESVD